MSHSNAHAKGKQVGFRSKATPTPSNGGTSVLGNKSEEWEEPSKASDSKTQNGFLQGTPSPFNIHCDCLKKRINGFHNPNAIDKPSLQEKIFLPIRFAISRKSSKDGGVTS